MTLGLFSLFVAVLVCAAGVVLAIVGANLGTTPQIGRGVRRTVGMRLLAAGLQCVLAALAWIVGSLVAGWIW